MVWLAHEAESVPVSLLGPITHGHNGGQYCRQLHVGCWGFNPGSFMSVRDLSSILLRSVAVQECTGTPVVHAPTCRRPVSPTLGKESWGNIPEMASRCGEDAGQLVQEGDMGRPPEAAACQASAQPTVLVFFGGGGISKHMDCRDGPTVETPEGPRVNAKPPGSVA